MLGNDCLASVFAHFPVVHGLAPALRERFASDATELVARAGTALCAEGGDCPGLVLLTAGSARAVRQRSGRSIVLYRVRPGGICPLSAASLLAERPAPAAVLADLDLTGIVLPRDAFDRLLGDAPEWRRFVFERI